MLMKWELERFASDKQCIERAVTMWKEWMSKKKTYNDDLAAEGTMYVVKITVFMCIRNIACKCQDK
ncbi:hypothetical protein CON72_10405, partial [Bacillus wiedmannii]